MEENKVSDEESLFLEWINAEDKEGYDHIVVARSWFNISKERQEEYIAHFPEILKVFESLLESHPNAENFALAIINCTSDKVTKAYSHVYEMCLKKIIECAEQGRTMSDIFRNLYLVMRNDLKEDMPEIFSQLTEYLTNNPQNIVGCYPDVPIMREDFPFSVYCRGLDCLYEKEEDVRGYLEKEVEVSREDLLKNEALMKKFPGQKICLGVKNVAEFSLQELTELKEKFQIEHIVMNDPQLSDYQTHPYEFNEFFRCRQIIDEIIDGIEPGNPNDSNREKKIFGQVMKRLAEHMSYDHDHINESDKVKELEKQLRNSDEMTEEARSEIKAKINALRENIDYITPRNMVGGLINNTCVCAGYAEIVRNVFACLGIEATYIQGFPDEENDGHAWNQIKLDGKWYNMDLTWDRDRIVDGIEPCCMLMSDKDFNDKFEAYDDEHYSHLAEGHGIYSVDRFDEHVCDTTIPKEEVHKYITFDPEQDKKKNWLRSAAEKCSNSRVHQVARAVIEVMTRHNYKKQNLVAGKTSIER